jgi:hypothetical protein
MNKLLILLLSVLLVFFTSCSESDDDSGTGPDDTPDSIVGSWISTGDDVAPLLNAIFIGNGGIDTVYATFGSDNIYNVRQVNTDKTVLLYTGTYSASKSNVGEIFTISISQTSPATATVEGIYEIDFSAEPDKMTYEVVQTDPPAGTATTPEAGFGSTSGGAYEMQNVQKYVRTE